MGPKSRQKAEVVSWTSRMMAKMLRAASSPSSPAIWKRILRARWMASERLQPCCTFLSTTTVATLSLSLFDERVFRTQTSSATLSVTMPHSGETMDSDDVVSTSDKEEQEAARAGKSDSERHEYFSRYKATLRQRFTYMHGLVHLLDNARKVQSSGKSTSREVSVQGDGSRPAKRTKVRRHTFYAGVTPLITLGPARYSLRPCRCL